jgi:hypothetical protein
MGGSARGSAGEHPIGPLNRSEVPALLAAWNDAFGGQRPGFVPRTEADWEARFGDNPLGLRSFVARDGERILCQYAAQPLRARLQGETVSFAQVVDTFVVPDLRRGLVGARLFLRTARAFFDTHGAHGGNGDHDQGEPVEGVGRDVLYYGWPVPPVRRLGTAHLEYTLTDRLLLLGREPGSGPTGSVDGVSTWLGSASNERSVPALGALFEACNAGWGASILRDEDWFRWRFLERDPAAYRVLCVGDPGAPGGLAVLRHGDWPLANTLALVDWLVPEDEREAGQLLEEAARRLARELGAGALVAHFPPWSPWFERFQTGGWRVHASDLFLVTRPFLRRLEPLWLRDHLWFQLSDTDLV